jgi:hypothetical protein
MSYRNRINKKGWNKPDAWVHAYNIIDIANDDIISNKEYKMKTYVIVQEIGVEGEPVWFAYQKILGMWGYLTCVWGATSCVGPEDCENNLRKIVDGNSRIVVKEIQI